MRLGSERQTVEWYENLTGLAEVMDLGDLRLSASSLYRVQDKLVAHKEELEEALVERQRQLYGEGDKICLFDLTNTYFEGNPASELAKRGHWKDKRYDRPLVTLGLVVDEQGFVKASKVFAGNVAEPGTLGSILEELGGQVHRQAELLGPRPTVVIDAGIATEANRELIRAKGFDYVCVDRSRPKELPQATGAELVHEGGDSQVWAVRLEAEGEVILYCTSTGRRAKEESMRNKFQRAFEQGLEKLAASVERKGGIKRYDKVVERIGRLKERYSMVAHFYQVEVAHRDGKAVSIRWRLKDEKEIEARFSGHYKIRSSRTDLSAAKLWELYNMLTEVEASFRTLKQDLRIRPVYHRVSRRIEGHIFVTVLAYHVLSVIQAKLRQAGIRHHWTTLRRSLSSHVRVTTTARRRDGSTVLVRQSSRPEPFQREVYEALGIRACARRAIQTVR